MTLIELQQKSLTPLDLRLQKVTGSSALLLSGEHLCAVPGGDGDCVQCSQEIEDADTQQQPGEPDWNTDMVSRERAGFPKRGSSGYEIVELLRSKLPWAYPVVVTRSSTLGLGMVSVSIPNCLQG